MDNKKIVRKIHSCVMIESTDKTYTQADIDFLISAFNETHGQAAQMKVIRVRTFDYD